MQTKVDITWYRIERATALYRELLEDYDDIISIARKQAVRQIKAEMSGLQDKGE